MLQYKMYIVLFITILADKARSQSCENVINLSKDLKLGRHELNTLKPKDIVDCLPQLGIEKLNIAEAEFFWDSIVSYYQNVSGIPDEVLSSLKWVTIGIKPNDYKNLTLNTLDVIENFGQDYGLSRDQLLAIADRVREDFGNKQPKDYTFYDLKALGQIICVFNGSEIVRIHAKAYREAVLIIRNLKNCDEDVLEGFAYLSVDKNAFGSPDTWNRETICLLGVVAKYLPNGITMELQNNLGIDIIKESNQNIAREEDCERQNLSE